MRRLGLALALAAAAALGLLEVAWGQTFPRDDTGAVAPSCVWRSGATGAYNFCGDANPLPMAAAGGPPASSDPTGWGRRFFAGSSLGTSNLVGLWIDDQTAYAWGIDGANTLNFFRSADRGITWATMGTLTFPNSGGLQGALGPLTDGNFLLSNGPGSNVATLHKGSAGGGFTAVPGSAVAGMTTMWSLRQQGSTILAAGSPTAGGMFICRSTNLAATITCTQPAGFGGAVAGNGADRVASPAANIWLAIDDGRTVWRSTDDGLTWTSITTLPGSGGGENITCLTSSVCLATSGTQGNISRSTDAGLTWSLVYVNQGANMTAFLNYGEGVVVAPNALNNTATAGARSADFGATWTQLAPLTGGPAGAPQIAVTRAGRGLIFGGGSPSVVVTYTVALGAGEVGLVGPNGVRQDINNLGHAGVYQGAAAASTAPWPFTNVQGPTLFNTRTVSAANTAVSATIAAVASVRAHVYSVSARCSAGSASLSITDGGTTIWDTAAGEVGTNSFTRTWDPGLTGATNSAVVVTLGACGAANTGTLIVQADRF